MNPLKRVFDVFICIALAVPAILVITIAAPIVAIETRSSPFFRQKRMGRNLRPFTMLKLRSMSVNTPDGASHEIGDHTVTRSGRLLRQTKIDEIPQLWNVLIGEMSLVGPRPCLPSQSRLINEREQLGVMRIRPGITGVAQLAGLDMSDPVALAQADATYLGPWSLFADLRLLSLTVTGRGSGDAARPRQ